MTIIRVRRMLSETEIERYGIPKWGRIGLCSRDLPYWKYSITIPIPTLVGLVQSIAAGLWRGKMRTQRGKVQEAGKGDSPDACRVDDVAAVDLGAEQA